MLRKNIMIVSHNFHTFLLNEIEYASSQFENVIVVSLHDNQLVQKFGKTKNIRLELFTKQQLQKKSLLSLYKFLQKETVEDMRVAKKQKVFDKLYVKNLLLYLGLENIVECVASKYGVLHNPDDWVLLAAWYSAPAFAVSKLKKKEKGLVTVSLAHSFEIDKRKTKYTDVLFRKTYVNYLDCTSFISENVLKEYLEEHSKTLLLDGSKFEVRYLGTHKLLEGKNQGNKDSRKIRIMSCSYIVPIKRVELIVNSISRIQNYDVEWYHIGTGSMYDTLEQMIQNNKNSRVKSFLLGSKMNEEVHRFLVDEKLDLFINVSASEGIPVSIMEALAYGVPVVATDVGGNSEIIDSSCGILLHSNPSEEEIMNSILQIKEMSDGDKTQLRECAITRYERLFNSDITRPDFYRNLSNLS